MTIGQRGRGIWLDTKKGSNDFKKTTKNEIKEMFDFFIFKSLNSSTQLELNILNLLRFNNPFICEFLNDPYYASFLNTSWTLKKMYSERDIYNSEQKKYIEKWMTDEQKFIIFCIYNDTEKAIPLISNKINFDLILPNLTINPKILDSVMKVIDLFEYAIIQNNKEMIDYYIQKCNDSKIENYIYICLKHDKNDIVYTLIKHQHFVLNYFNHIKLLEEMIKYQIVLDSNYFINIYDFYKIIVQQSIKYNNIEMFKLFFNLYLFNYPNHFYTIVSIYKSGHQEMIKILEIEYNKILKTIKLNSGLSNSQLVMITKLAKYKYLPHILISDLSKINLNDIYDSNADRALKFNFIHDYLSINEDNNAIQPDFTIQLLECFIKMEYLDKLILIIKIFNKNQIINVLMEYMKNNINNSIFNIFSEIVETYKIKLNNDLLLQKCMSSATNEGIVKIFPFIF